MATSYPTQQQPMSSYEEYVRANWYNLSAYEQEQARAYFQAKQLLTPAYAPVKTAPGWTIGLGYVCCVIALIFFPIVFGPAGFGLGLYNKKHGRASQGTTLMVASAICGIIGMILGVIVWASM
jgi:hypothetical protein